MRVRSGHRSGVALDLGTAHFRVATRNRLIAEESAVVAFDDGGAAVALGDPAAALRSSPRHRVVRPVEGATVSDPTALRDALVLLFDLASTRCHFRPTTVLAMSLCAPASARAAFVDSVGAAWSSDDVQVVDSPVAAAIGAGIGATDPEPVLVVDIGRGATEAAVISASRILAGASKPIGGDDVDRALERYLRTEHGLVVPLHDVESAKIAMSCRPDTRADVAGADVVTGTRRTRSVSAAEMVAAVAATVDEMAAVAVRALDEVPRAARASVRSRGVVLTGGGSALVGLRDRVADITGAAVREGPSVQRAVIDGVRSLLTS